MIGEEENYVVTGAQVALWLRAAPRYFPTGIPHILVRPPFLGPPKTTTFCKSGSKHQKTGKASGVHLHPRETFAKSTGTYGDADAHSHLSPRAASACDGDCRTAIALETTTGGLYIAFLLWSLCPAATAPAATAQRTNAALGCRQEI